MKIFQRHPHAAEFITSIPKLLGSKCFGNYGSVDDDPILQGSNNVLHLKTHIFQKAPETVKSFRDMRTWEGKGFYSRN